MKSNHRNSAVLAETAVKNKIKQPIDVHRKHQLPSKEPKSINRTKPQKPAGTKPQEAIETF